MLDRLFEWRALADAERFADLFDALLHQSGLAYAVAFLFVFSSRTSSTSSRFLLAMHHGAEFTQGNN